jgi:formylmethanofuran dehydrogenase subunit C
MNVSEIPELMVLKLTYRTQTPIPVEVEGFTPDWACGKTLADIERFMIFHGNQSLPLAELFSVSGDSSDKQQDWEGNLSGVHWIGAHMTSGTIRIHGSAGRHVGSDLRGGSIIVDGDAGDWVGAEMHRGLIRVKGNSGHLTGSAYRGSTSGMTGGMILVDGDSGNEIGLSMRRGFIAVQGSAGDMLGGNMIAGTVLVFGRCGIRPGAGMRRGTIGLFGTEPPQLLPSFRFGCTYQPQVMQLMLQTLQKRDFEVDESLYSTDIDLYHGDLITIGKGEILFRHAV